MRIPIKPKTKLLLTPGVTRLLYYKGIEAVGTSVNASIFAIYPVYTSIFAVLLLGEALTAENCIGIICIVVGVAFLEISLSKPNTGSKRTFKKGLVFPLLATLTVSLSTIARKHGLNIYSEPFLGVAIGYSSTFPLIPHIVNLSLYYARLYVFT